MREYECRVEIVKWFGCYEDVIMEYLLDDNVFVVGSVVVECKMFFWVFVEVKRLNFVDVRRVLLLRYVEYLLLSMCFEDVVIVCFVVGDFIGVLDEYCVGFLWC